MNSRWADGADTAVWDARWREGIETQARAPSSLEATVPSATLIVFKRKHFHSFREQLSRTDVAMQITWRGVNVFKGRGAVYSLPLTRAGKEHGAVCARGTLSRLTWRLWRGWKELSRFQMGSWGSWARDVVGVWYKMEHRGAEEKNNQVVLVNSGAS